MADTIPVAQLRAFVERIERIEADIKDLNGDKSEVYKELRGCGFDVKAVRAVVAKRKLDTADREERDAMFDLYWSALNGEDRARAHAREIIEEFDPETGEITDEPDAEFQISGGNEPAAAGSATDEASTSSAPATICHSAATSSRQSEAAGDDDLLPVVASTLSNPSLPTPVPLGSATSERGADVAAASPSYSDDDLEIPEFLRRADKGVMARVEA